MIHAENVSARYGASGPQVLAGLSLRIPRGSLFGLLGPNGAGKTTLVRTLLGLLTPTAGRVSIDGLDIPRQRQRLASRVGLAPQTLAFYPSMSARENLDFFDRMRPANSGQRPARIEAAVQQTGLGAHAGKKTAHLSGGLQRRLNLAIALLGEPPLLVLDEPTVGVDAQSRKFILETLRDLNDKGSTILYVTHYMDEVERLCDRAAIVDGGRVQAYGTLTALLHDAPDLETLFLRLTGSHPRD